MLHHLQLVIHRKSGSHDSSHLFRQLTVQSLFEHIDLVLVLTYTACLQGIFDTDPTKEKFAKEFKSCLFYEKTTQQNETHSEQ